MFKASKKYVISLTSGKTIIAHCLGTTWDAEKISMQWLFNLNGTEFEVPTQEALIILIQQLHGSTIAETKEIPND